jgi:hypothetical protein
VDRPLAVFDVLALRFATRDYRGCAFINTIVESANRHDAGAVVSPVREGSVEPALRAKRLAALLLSVPHPTFS